MVCSGIKSIRDAAERARTIAGLKALRAITNAGFVLPPELQQLPGSNVARHRRYDRIAHYRKLSKMCTTGRAGIFDFYEPIDRDATAYDALRNGRGSSCNEWRTYQMNGHPPMWIAFAVDDSAALTCPPPAVPA